MKHGRIFFTALTLITVLAISGGCSKQNTPADAVYDEIDTADTILEIPAETQSSPATQKLKETSIPSDSTNLFPAYEYVNGVKQYGFIDETGTFIILPGYSSVTDFSDGYAIISGIEDYKVIDKSGKIIYESDTPTRPYRNGAAVFMKSVDGSLKEGYIDTSGKTIIKPRFLQADDFRKDNTAFVSTETGKYALIDKSGNILESYRLDKKYNNVITFKDGYIIYSDEASGNTGVVDYKGEEIFKPAYKIITYLGEGLFAVKDPAMEYSVTKNTHPDAIFDKDGTQLTDYIFYDISEFHNGYASATNSQYTYFIDKKGKEVTDLPKIEGRGTMTLTGDIVKAEIDDDLIYMTRDGMVIWQNDRTHTLSSQITVKELKYKPNKYVYVYYPYIEGLPASIQTSVNGTLYKLFTDSRADIREEDGLSVEDTFKTELLKDLIIINKNGYDYPIGAAHGSPIRDYYFIDTKTGEFYDLSDLFKKKSNYEKLINQIIGKKIEAQSKQDDSYFFPDSFEGIKENQPFIITKEALVIYFYPYEIAAYAAGFPEFKIPFEQLKEVIDYEGSFWNSFQDTIESLN